MGLEIINEAEADQIHAGLAGIVRQHLPFATWAFTSGSVPYGAAVRGRSDADVNIVFAPGTIADPPLIAAINRFVEALEALHTGHGLVLDRKYPGEYLTVLQARDAAAGRGVPIKDGVACLPHEPGDSYWDTSEETWYLAWLGAISFSRLIYGNQDTFCDLRRKSWQTLVLLCLSDLRDQHLTDAAVLQRVSQHDHSSGGFGIQPGYRRFADLELASVQQALSDLSGSGFLHPAAGGYRVDQQSLDSWHAQLAAHHRDGYAAANLLTVASSLQVAR
jgi:hypothetical protein